ncbi:sensor histidine kinase [Jiangella mangrovi]|uniref:histidine kinase n=1 Tax=Jiangella mangrovi TaxID=1524084 RepID=A0A7W9GNA1_9ACTN|nr:ATP-binding protein [Jiangella mangrovi]MBB5786834.1 two-component system sensor histidine kinase BaeS [Jiangella mangrovi]
MRRNLFVRLIGLSLGVAVMSIAATAWITTQSTSERLRGTFERTLEGDSFVYQRLIAYGQEHDSWDGVGAVVDELATAVGNRVALTEPDGEVIADSAASDGAAPPLPSTPTAEVDPMAPVAVMAGGAVAPLAAATRIDGGGVIAGDVKVGSGSGGSGTASPSVPPDGVTATPFEDITVHDAPMSWTLVGAGAMPPDAASSWRLTDEEGAARQQLAAAANTCLQDVGDGAIIVSFDGAILRVTSEPAAGVTSAPANTTSMVALDAASHGCIPAELSAPSAASQDLNENEVRLAELCLAEAGVATKPMLQPNGLVTLTTERDDAAATESLRLCSTQASQQAMEPYLADAALLYIGSTDRFDAFSGDGWVRTVLAGLGVLVAATGVTVLAGRRLTHPIRTLTEAAQRMASGGRGARVRVAGHDEVARLGDAFNAMASSIEENERQRKAMVSDIAHELRTPLANVRGYLEAAEDGVVPLDPQLVSSLLEESALLQRLIDDLQDLALADAGMLRVHREETDVAELARQVVAAHQPSASSSGTELVVAVSASAEIVAEVDPVRLRQALGNLVANAVQYSGDGATVLVRVSRDSSSDEVVLAVRDDGPGIAPEHLEHLFDRFYRTDTSRTRATGGSGLGLAITRHLVEAHEGTVTVSSMVGAGSTFTIRLPMRVALPASLS